MTLLLLAAELVILYLLAQRLTQALFDLVVLLTKSRTVGITFITLVSFPGTVVHELSHLFTAEILGVHTGKLTLIPEGITTDEIKAGSVMIAQTDPFRRYFIGLAPVFTGLVAVGALSYILMNPATLPFQSWIISVIVIYLLTSVANAMFSSNEDLKGFVPFAITLLLVVTAAYLAGLRIGITGVALSFTTELLDGLTKSMGIVLGLNVAGLILTNLLMFAAAKLTRQKIIRR